MDAKRAKSSDAIVYWHDLTTVAYERLVEDFDHVVKVFANGAKPLA